MKSFFYNLFVSNWQRKCISLTLSIVIWFIVNHSLTGIRTFEDITVRITNIPEDKTIDGLLKGGVLNKKISLTLFGSNSLLNEISSNDFEVIIDAQDHPDEWIVSLNKKDLVSTNPNLDFSKGVSRVMHKSFIIHLTKLIKEKIPIIVTQPIGEPPKGYQFLDVYPYNLTLTVQGPEEILKPIKTKGVKLTFNLNDLSKDVLDKITSDVDSPLGTEISYYVPSNWKQVLLPVLSELPIEIDDPKAKDLRIDFVKSDLIPIENPIPIALFFSPEYLDRLNPEEYQIAVNDCIEKIKSINFLKIPLFAKGVSSLFLEVVQEMLQIQVIVTPQQDSHSLQWSLQCIDSRMLEDRYISILMSNASDHEIPNTRSDLLEEHLRNRFRNYMQRFLLCKGDNTKLKLNIRVDNHVVSVLDGSKS